MSTAQIVRSWHKAEDGNHYPVCPITIDAESQEQAKWLAFWRFEAEHDRLPEFQWSAYCPCGYHEESCQCVVDDPAKIAHEVPR